MTRLKRFIRTSLLGGLTVLLPVGLTLAIFAWLFRLIRGIIQPLTDVVVSRAEVSEYLSILLVLVALTVICFVVGLIVRTAVGRFVHNHLEGRVLKIAPGYNTIKEIIAQFLGNRPSPFSSAALVRLFGNDTLVTAFVTERHENGMCSVFVPTGPNPTSGNIYHLQADAVHHIDIPIETVMRTTIACGAGSADVIKALEDVEQTAKLESPQET